MNLFFLNSQAKDELATLKQDVEKFKNSDEVSFFYYEFYLVRDLE